MARQHIRKRLKGAWPSVRELNDEEQDWEGCTAPSQLHLPESQICIWDIKKWSTVGPNYQNNDDRHRYENKWEPCIGSGPSHTGDHSTNHTLRFEKEKPPCAKTQQLFMQGLCFDLAPSNPPKMGAPKFGKDVRNQT